MVPASSNILKDWLKGNLSKKGDVFPLLSCEALQRPLIHVSFLRNINKKKEVQGQMQQWEMRSLIMSTLFVSTFTGFVCKKRGKKSPLGSHYTGSSNLDSSKTHFFQSWIKFLVSMITVYPQRSQTPTLQPCLWSAAYTVSKVFE